MEGQNITITWGDFAYGSELNAYKLALTLKENKVDQEKNQSNVNYKLVLESGINNRFTGQIDSVIKLAGVQVASGVKKIQAAYSSSWVLLEGSADIAHNNDGSLNMPIEVSINTYNSYAPPDKTFNYEWPLTTIPRASSITSAEAVTLGEKCKVIWTPASESFWYKLTFTLEEWSSTTEPIHPDTVDPYTFEDVIPLAGVAEQLPDSSSGQMQAVLTTYGDAECTKEIGAKEASFTVTIPENDETRPKVKMELFLVKDFEGLILQNRTAIKPAVLTAEGVFGASIKSLGFEIEGKTYGADATSEPLTKTGQLTVTGTAEDSRGFIGKMEELIEVIPYYRPRLEADAFRCLANGLEDDTGEWLRVEGKVEYASVETKNGADLFYRYKSENGQYGGDIVLFENVASGKQKVSDPLLEGLLLKEIAYSVQIVARDKVGEETVVTVAIPSERIYKHKRPGGKGLGLGGYCDQDDLLDVYWHGKIRKGLVIGHGVGSVFITVSEDDPSAVFDGVWQKLEEGVPPAVKMWVRSE